LTQTWSAWTAARKTAPIGPLSVPALAMTTGDFEPPFSGTVSFLPGGPGITPGVPAGEEASGEAGPGVVVEPPDGSACDGGGCVLADAAIGADKGPPATAEDATVLDAVPSPLITAAAASSADRATISLAEDGARAD
jgi:hypothetical protein